MSEKYHSKMSTKHVVLLKKGNFGVMSVPGMPASHKSNKKEGGKGTELGIVFGFSFL